MHQLLHDGIADIEPRLLRHDNACRQAEAQEPAPCPWLVVIIVSEEGVAGAQDGQDNGPSREPQFDGTDPLPHRIDECAKTHGWVDSIQYAPRANVVRAIPFPTLRGI